MNKIIGFAMMWILLAMLGGIMELAQFSVGSGATGTPADATSHLQILLMGIDWSEASDFTGFITVGIGFVRTWVATFADMLFFNYPFLQGEWGILRWIIFLPFGIGLIWLLWNSIRGNSTSG